jgi:hypothetical protein
VRDFRTLVKGLGYRLKELDELPKRFLAINQDEPINTILERIRAYAYAASVMVTALEKRDAHEEYVARVAELTEKYRLLHEQVQRQKEQLRLQ